MRRALVLAAATLVSLALPAAPAEARKRCCFRAVITGSGFMETIWGQKSDWQSGGDYARWSWSERHILVYEEADNGTPSLRHARLRQKPVRPSTVYYGASHSTVGVGEPPDHRPAADPDACAEVRVERRDGVTPELRPPSTADQGALTRFPNATMFLSVGSEGAVRSGLGNRCLYGHDPENIEVWKDQPCPGQHHFWLPAPRRAWFRKGETPIERAVGCNGAHAASDLGAGDGHYNHQLVASGEGRVRLSWFPPRKLEDEAERLAKAHREAAEAN
jgi:hypothetical protein